LTTPVWKYFRLQPYENTTAKVALAFAGGDPAIIEEKILHGRTILFAGAADDSLDRLTTPPTPWTAIQTWPSFPPLVQEMLALAVRGRSAGRNVLVGEDLEGVVHNSLGDVLLTLVKPDGRDERVSLTIDGQDSRWIWSEAHTSGIYEARFGPPRNESQLLAVNVDTRESNLERLDEDLLPSQFARDYHGGDLDAPKLPSSPRAQLFQYLLAFMLVLLIGESFLAWLFGRAKV
jgi:hypothetical protein